tara:strand:- start:1840 stop:2367 length:528 start_codon:yes stop_codon:yes gene_type:complete
MKRIIQGAALLFAVLLSTTLYAQDISGDYTLTANESPGGDNCAWSGELTLTQSGGNPGTFAGTGTANVVSGPCLNFSGSLSGNIDGSTLDFGVAVGGGGSVDFDGSLSGANLSGNWSGLGLAGTWSAIPVVVPPPPPPPVATTAIPTMPIYALIFTTLGLLLVAARRLHKPTKRG